MSGTPFRHEWGFMASGLQGRADLVQCQYETCRKWQFGDEKPFKMTHEEYVAMHDRGEIDASEVLGYEPGQGPKGA